MWLSCLLPSLLIPALGRAAPVQEPSRGEVQLIAASASGPVVLDLLPDGANRNDARRQVSKTLGKQASLEPPDERLVSAVRWAMSDPARDTSCRERSVEARSSIEAGGWVPLPDSDRGLSSALLQQATEQYGFLELEGVLETLEILRGLLVCESRIASRDDLLELYRLDALARLLRKDGSAKEAFRTLLAAEPEVPLEAARMTDEVQLALEVAKRELSTSSRIPLSDAASPGRFYVDGYQPTPLAIWSGKHLVQWEGSDGVIRGAWLTLPLSRSGGNVDKVDLSALPDFGLASRADAWRQLSRAPLSRTPPDAVLNGLDQYLHDTRRSVLLVLAAPGPDAPPVLRMYRSGVGFKSYSPSSRSENDIPDEVMGSGTGGAIALERPPRAVLAVGIEGQLLLGDRVAYIAHARRAGYQFTVDLLRSSTVVELRAGFLPYALGDDGASCGAPTGGTSLADLEGAVSCLPARPSITAGVGVGVPLELVGRLSLTPLVSISGAYLPWTVLGEEGADVESVTVGQGYYGGPMAHARVTLRMGRLQRVMRVNLEAFGGVMGAKAGDRFLLAYPVGALALGSMAF